MGTLRVTAALRLCHDGSGPCSDEGLRAAVTSSLARVRLAAAYTAPAFSPTDGGRRQRTHDQHRPHHRAKGAPRGRGLERRDYRLGTATATAVSARPHRPGPAPDGAAPRSELPLDEPPHRTRMGLLPRARGADAPEAPARRRVPGPLPTDIRLRARRVELPAHVSWLLGAQGVRDGPGRAPLYTRTAHQYQ